MQDKQEKPVLIMAGGTGGHVFPGLAVAEELFAQGVPVEWLGTSTGIEARVVPMADIPLHFLPVVGLRGKKLSTLPKAFLQLFVAQWQAIKLMYLMKPSCVLGMGGFASGPGGVAAWLLGVPVVLHEQNAVLGTTNKLLSNFSTTLLQAFPKAFSQSRARTLGNPIRKEIVSLHKNNANSFAEKKSDLKVLVLGGSLGALAINEVLPEVISLFPEGERPKVRHQTGKNKADDVRVQYRQLELNDVVVVPFIDDMREAYAWADVVICRAGALTVSELAIAGLPAVLIPFPHAIDDHQTLNAKTFVDAGAGLLVPQSELTAKRLFTQLNKIIESNEALQMMKDAAWELAKPNAASDVAQECLKVSK